MRKKIILIFDNMLKNCKMIIIMDLGHEALKFILTGFLEKFKEKVVSLFIN